MSHRLVNEQMTESSVNRKSPSLESDLTRNRVLCIRHFGPSIQSTKDNSPSKKTCTWLWAVWAWWQLQDVFIIIPGGFPVRSSQLNYHLKTTESSLANSLKINFIFYMYKLILQSWLTMSESTSHILAQYLVLNLHKDDSVTIIPKWKFERTKEHLSIYRLIIPVKDTF